MITPTHNNELQLAFEIVTCLRAYYPDDGRIPQDGVDIVIQDDVQERVRCAAAQFLADAISLIVSVAGANRLVLEKP